MAGPVAPRINDWFDTGGQPTTAFARYLENIERIGDLQEELKTKAALGSGVINAQSGTSYTLVASDKGKTITMSNANANSLIIPAGVFAGGDEIHWAQIGDGQTTIDASAVTPIAYDDVLTSLGKGALGTIKCLGSDVFLIGGGLG